MDVPKEEEVVGSDVEKKRHLNVVFIGHVGESPC